MDRSSSQNQESYRNSVAELKPWLSASIWVAAAGYAGALWAGNSPFGWYFLVVAIASSFVLTFLGIHMQEQEQTVDLRAYMLELAERKAAPRAQDGV